MSHKVLHAQKYLKNTRSHSLVYKCRSKPTQSSIHHRTTTRQQL